MLTYSKNFILGTTLVCALMMASTACTTASGAKQRQYIFSLSNHQQSSRSLGAAGVPAYIALRGGNRRGFYITSVTNGGNWRQMGLQPGDLLISIGGHIITDAGQADSAIASSPGAQQVVIAATNDDGVPEMRTVRANIVPTASGGMPVANPNALAAEPKNWQKEANESTSSLEEYMLELVNQDRAANGLSPVSGSSSLASLARYYAQYLADHKIFGHVDDQKRTPQTRAKQYGIRAGVYENLAMQQLGWGSGRQMVNAAERFMMNEPPDQINHRSNILGPGRQYVGIGIARGNGNLMMVQEFTDSSP